LRALAAAILAGSFLLLPAGAALAHPQGQKPVALIEARGDALEVTWVAASDDFAILLRHEHVISGGYDPSALPPNAAARALAPYLLARVGVSDDGAICPGAVTGGGITGTGVAVGMRFDCGHPLGAVVVRLTLLQDLSPDYYTIAGARTPGGVVRGVFSPTSPEFPLSFTAAAPSPAPERVPAAGAPPAGRSGRIVAMLEGRHGSAGLAAALALALALGAFHGLTPGHGKTVTAAYLVGEGGSSRQAFALGGIVSATHAASVALLGAIAISIDRLLLPSRWVPWTEVGAGALIVLMGILLLLRRPGHAHGPGRVPTWGRLAALGIVGGLIPSPEALGVLLAAGSLGRWGMGMALASAFSVGLALVVLGVAQAAVRGARVMSNLSVARWVPVAGAAVVLAMGASVIARGAVHVIRS
jgi:ABC-type nickel/cobalt efflux system permease component RcnA